MSSIDETSDKPPQFDDRTTKARIRDAAIMCIGECGVTGATVRKVAVAAGVSPALVIHHFGSMEGLRTACDEYVAARIRQSKEEAISAGLNVDVLATLREINAGQLMGYLAAVLVEDSPLVAKLVDDLVADAEGYLRKGVEAGMIRPATDSHSRAAVLTLWSLGALVMHKHLRRLLGVDLTDPYLGADIAAYAGPVYEMMGEGLLTETFAVRMHDILADMGNGKSTDNE